MKTPRLGLLPLFFFEPPWFPVSNGIDHPKCITEDTSTTLSLASALSFLSNRCLNILLCSGFCAL